MLKSKVFIIIAVLCGIAAPSFSQSADDVIDGYVKAIGGADKINSVKTMKATGKFIQGNFEAPVVQTISRPDKVRLDMTMQGMTMEQGYDGSTGWTLNPFQGTKKPEKMTSEDAKDMKEQAEFEGSFVNYKKNGAKMDLLGKEDFEGSEAYKLKMTDKDGDISTYYFDAQTYLLLKETKKRKVKEKEITSETVYGEYKPVEGLLLPMSVDIKGGAGNESVIIKVEKYEINVPVDDAIFKMPEEK